MHRCSNSPCRVNCLHYFSNGHKSRLSTASLREGGAGGFSQDCSAHQFCCILRPHHGSKQSKQMAKINSRPHLAGGIDLLLDDMTDSWLCISSCLTGTATFMGQPCDMAQAVPFQFSSCRHAVLCCAGADVGLDKWLCVTLILAAEATVKLPKIRSLAVSNSLHAYC